MRRRWVALIILVAIAVVLGVFAASRVFNDDDNNDPAPSGSSTPTPTPEIITEATREREDVEITVRTDKEEYGAREKIPATAVVKNNRDTAVTYTPVIPGEDAFRMTALSLVPLGAAQLEPVGDAPPLEGTLEPGDELEMEVEWDGVLDIQQSPVTAPPGRYSILGTFVFSLPDSTEPLELEAAVTFRIEGTEPVLTPLDVLGRAILTDELAQWMEGRANNVICASPSTGFFYQGFITNQTAAETFDFLYTTQAESGLPICGITTDGPAWRLNFFSEEGPAPNRFNMLFDLSDGTLIGTEEPTPAPAPSPGASP